MTKIKPKKLHHDQEKERKASWLELFFDLSLVVPVFQLSHYLADHFTVIGALTYVVLFMAVLNTWQHHTYYHEQFQLPEREMRALTLVKILLLICMTAFIPTATENGKIGFIVFFCAIRLLMTFLWEWSATHHTSMAKLTRRYSRGTILGTILLIGSIWAPDTWLLPLWLGAIILDIIIPIVAIQGQEGLENMSFSDHLPERFGLFFLILLGESIISVTFALLENTTSFLAIAPAAILGLCLVFGIWWLYIDNVMAKSIQTDSMTKRHLWQQGHVGLFLVLPALGAGIGLLLKHFEAPPKEEILFIAGAIAFVLIFTAVIERSINKQEHAPCQGKKGLSWRIIAIITLFLALKVPANWSTWFVFLLLNGVIWGQVLVAEKLQKTGSKHYFKIGI